MTPSEGSNTEFFCRNWGQLQPVSVLRLEPMTWKTRSDKLGFVFTYIWMLPPFNTTLHSRWIRPRVSTAYLCLNTRQEPRLLTSLSSIRFVTFSCRVYGHLRGAYKIRVTRRRSIEWSQ